MARKALIFLWKEPNPRKDIPLMKAIDDYEVKLVYDSVNQSDHRATAYSVRDPHTPSEYIRMLSFFAAGTTSDSAASHSAPRSGTALGLVFCLPRRKTNKKGENMYATVFRHKNIHRCNVGGFAFYMFERFEIEKEPIPFSKPDEWYRIKVLVGGSVKDRMDPRSSHYRFSPLEPKHRMTRHPRS